MKDEEAAGQERRTDQDLSVYAGRWVALAGDQVVGVGETAMAAERLGRRNRIRERLAVYFVEPEGGQRLDLPELLFQLQPIFQGHDQPVHLVGGAVRDMLMGRPIVDLDFAVPKDAIGLAFKVANSLGLPAYILDRERDAGRVMLADNETTLDFAGYRGEDLLSDLRNRDFTINAMALPAAARTASSLVDPCDGQADLAAGLIRFTHPAAINDDPVRALRGVRHAADFGFVIEDETRTAVRQAATKLDRVSIERVRDELLKMMRSDTPQNALGDMQELGLMAVVLPEIAALADIPQTAPHYQTVLAHSIDVLAWVTEIEKLIDDKQRPAEPKLAEAQERLEPFRSRLASYLAYRLDGGVSCRQMLRLGALFHDAGKAETMSIEPDGRIRFFDHARVGAKLVGRRLSELHMSREAVRHGQALVAGHMRPLFLAQNPELSRRAVYRFFRDYDSAGLGICLLAVADQLAISAHLEADGQWQGLMRVIVQLFEQYFERFTESVQPEPLLNGREVMDTLGIEQGPEVGRIMDALREAQAAGEVTTRDEAVQLIRRLAQGDAE